VNRRKLAFAILGPILSVALFFTVVELSTRLISWVNGNGFTLALHELDADDPGLESIYMWHPFVGYIFRPSSRIKAGHPNQKSMAVVNVDRHGFLAKDDGLTRMKPPDEIRLAFIGGSTTAGLNLNFQENWPGRVGDWVQDRLPGKTVRTINAGVPGFDTAMSLGNLALRVMPFSPDVVVIYHAYNDLKAIRGDVPFHPDYTHIHTRPYGFGPEPNPIVGLLHKSMAYVRLRNQYREYRRKADFEKGLLGNAGTRLDRIPSEAEETFSQHIRSMIAISREGGARVVLLSFATLHDPSLDFNSAEVLEKLDNRKKVELVAMAQFTPGLTIPAVFEGLRQYNAALARIAAQEQTEWVDMAKAIPHDDQFFVDRVHFTAAGAREMARHLAPVVLSCLKERTPIEEGKKD
jgi:lysophospholipase L1-like esterase